MPQDREAERAILGAILLDSKVLPIVVGTITPEDFFHHGHRLLFYCFLEMAKKNLPIDLLTVTDELGKEGELEAVGGIPYVSQLMDGVPHISNVEFYGKTVKEKSSLRALIHAASAMQQQALEASDDATEILDRAKHSIDTLAQEQTRTGLMSIEKIVGGSYERISRIFESEQHVTGLTTGYSTLDAMTAGLQPSEFIVLAARPSVGKTAFSLNIAENVAVRKNLPVAIFSLEMSKESLLLRLIASYGRVDGHKFRTGHLTAEDRSKVTRSLSQLAQLPIWIDDSSSGSIQEVAAKAQRLKQESGLSLVIVDYIQLLSSAGKRSANRQEEVRDISRALKGMAKDLQIPIIGLSQLTRAPEQENRKPQLADLRSSGGIEEDADVVLFIHRPNFYKKTEDLGEDAATKRAETDLIIAKQRNGPISDIKFIFQESITRFEERAPDD